MASQEPAELPNGIVVGWAVSRFYSEGTEGEAQKNDVLSLQFEIGPGKVAQQSFIFHPDDAAQVRRDLKNPTIIQLNEESTPS